MKDQTMIRMRELTSKEVVRAIKQFGISMVCLVCASLLTNTFFPEVLDKVGFLVTLLFGITFGIIVGTITVYNAVWKIPLEPEEALEGKEKK